MEEKIKSLDEIKQQYILKVLEESHWDFKKASSILKVSETYLRKRFFPSSSAQNKDR